MFRCLAVSVFLAVFAAPSAHAYDVATSSKGAPLHWEAAEVPFVPAFASAPDLPAVDVATAVATEAAATWQADLEGKLVLSIGSSAPPAPHTVDGVNTIRWAIAADDPDLERGLLARTFLAYDAATGVLRDADIVLDAHDFAWTVGGACSNEYDLESALAHEFGHALGLGHAVGHPDATMFATGDACDTRKRDLDPDDRAGLASLYPAADDGASGGCSSTPPTSADLAFVLGLAALAFALHRRTSRPATTLAPAFASPRRRTRPVDLTPALALRGRDTDSRTDAFAIPLRRRRRRPTTMILARRGGRALALAFAALAVAAASPARAAQLSDLSLDDLAGEAVAVVRGRVTSTVTVRDPFIQTDATITVDECLAGPCGKAIQIRRLGGELEGDGLYVDGEANLTTGVEVVVFVRLDRHRRARVLGGVQGVFTVERTLDHSGTERIEAVRDLRSHQVRAGRTGWRHGERERFDLATVRAAASRPATR
jgi:hypothetical protein